MRSGLSRRAVLAALPLALSLPSLAATAVPPVIHRKLQVNGISMHIAEQGTGPLVILCHGWPECWNSWHHQMAALAAAGYRAVAPDMRGFGDTDAPEAIDQYTIAHTVGDMVALAGALGDLPMLETWPQLYVDDADEQPALRALARAATAPAGASWTCDQCGEVLEPQFTTCWRCGGVSDKH